MALNKVRGGVAVLQNLSLTVFSGDFVVVSGASGSGKTTLLGIVGLLDIPTSGSYFLKRQPVHTLSDPERTELRRKTFGFIFQPFALMTDLNVWQNVARPLKYAGVSKRERREKALILLADLGLSKLAQRRPTQLSAGEQQRVAMARALVNGPDIILADEPTSNLPQVQRKLILETLEALHKAGKTVVLTTHTPLEVEASKRYVLDEGRLREVPTPLRQFPRWEPASEELQLRVLGRVQIKYRGERVAIAPRQVEVLVLLAAYPEGLSGEQLLLLAYGDEGNPVTLKATLSKLRRHVPISNRPYRLGTACRADFTQLATLLERGEVERAAELYQGELLPESDAPGIVELRESLAEAVRQAVLTSNNADAAFALAKTYGDDRALWEAALDALSAQDPKAALARAQLERIKKAWSE